MIYKYQVECILLVLSDKFNNCFTFIDRVRIMIDIKVITDCLKVYDTMQIMYCNYICLLMNLYNFQSEVHL